MLRPFEVRSGAFFICFDAGDEETQSTIQRKIVSAEFITSWWNRIPNLYILETDLSPEEFTNKLNELFPSETYLAARLVGEYIGRMEFDKWRHLMNVDEKTLRLLEIETTKIDEERKRAAMAKDERK